MKSCELMLTRNDEFKCKKCWANVSIYCRGSVRLARILQTVHNLENFPYVLQFRYSDHISCVGCTLDLRFRWEWINDAFSRIKVFSRINISLCKLFHLIMIHQFSKKHNDFCHFLFIFRWIHAEDVPTCSICGSSDQLVWSVGPLHDLWHMRVS